MLELLAEIRRRPCLRDTRKTWEAKRRFDFTHYHLVLVSSATAVFILDPFGQVLLSFTRFCKGSVIVSGFRSPFYGRD